MYCTYQKWETQSDYCSRLLILGNINISSKLCGAIKLSYIFNNQNECGFLPMLVMLFTK